MPRRLLRPLSLCAFFALSGGLLPGQETFPPGRERPIAGKVDWNCSEGIGWQAKFAADRILVASRYRDLLEAEGFPLLVEKGSSYVKVSVADSGNPDAIPALIRRLKALGVEELSTDGVLKAAGLSGDPVVGDGLAWHLDNPGLVPNSKKGADINATEGWDYQTDASAALIALLDSGIDQNDPDLVRSIRIAGGEIAGDGIDNDGNGYVDDVMGYDFRNRDGDPEDQGRHGSLVAGFIGAAGNDGKNSSGVAWKAAILNCKVLDQNGLGNVSDAIDAIDYAIAKGAKVINLSWTLDAESPLLTTALKRANDAGIIIVCSGGQHDPYEDIPLPEPVPYPASLDLPLMVTVAASAPDDTLAPFTLTDRTKIDLAAPGMNLRGELSGTSYATAMVSGSVALAISRYPSETPQEIVRRLLENTDPIPGGAAALASGGRLNLGKMLSASPATTPHDSFANRRVIPDSVGRWTGRNNGAGLEAIDTGFNLNPAPKRTIWFEWTAPWSGTLTLTPGPTKPWLRVFREAGGLPSALLSQSTAGKPLKVAVQQGQKLFWTLDGTNEVSGGLRIDWRLPPPNDVLAAATEITSFPFSVSGNTLGASGDRVEGRRFHSKFFPRESIWWKLTPPTDMTLNFSVRDGKGKAYLLPAKGKTASFPKNYDFLNSAAMPQQLAAGKSYYLLVVPSTPASSGAITVSGWGEGQLKITRQPEAREVSMGEYASVGFDAVGADLNWGVEWFKDDQSLGLGGPRLGPVTEESLGTYHVVVKKGTASETSRKVQVVARQEKPRLAEHVPVRRLIHGQTLHLHARFSNFGEMAYEWKKDGQTLADQHGAQLSVEDVKASDAGSYTVTATNAHGSSTADFTVHILETPWKHWKDRSPASQGRGRILQVSSQGTKVEALTSSEWLESTDGGVTWSSQALPSRFSATSGASLPDGTLLVDGTSFDGISYGLEGVWRRPPGGIWEKLDPKGLMPDGTMKEMTVEQVCSIGGKFYVSAGVGIGTWYSLAFESGDGITWTAVPHPVTPNTALEVEQMYRFSDALAINYWQGSSDQDALLLKSDGQREVFDLSSSRDLIQLDDGFVAGFPNFIGDNAEFETGSDGILRGVAENGVMYSGFERANLQAKYLYASSYARSNGRWILGYQDGSLWSGVNLFDAPAGKPGDGGGTLKVFNNEFIAGDWHSSDGARWQTLGPVTGDVVAYAGDHFLLKYFDRFRHPFDGAEGTMATFSLSVHPVPEAEATISGIDGNFWSGPDAVFRSYGASDGRITQFLRGTPAGTVAEDVNIGADWDFITDARKIGERWFIRGSEKPLSRPFVSSSSDGQTWSKSALLDGSVLGGVTGNYVAIMNAGRAFISPDGVRWKPVVLDGLPGAPFDFVSYRGYLMARYSRDVYVSVDGKEWFLAAPDLPLDDLVANRHTALGVSAGRIIQPDAETESGPWLKLSETLREVSTPLHQPFTFELEAGDADGDLQEVQCFANGQLHSSRTTAPFAFTLDAAKAEALALEFLARDGAGRISRTTATLHVLPMGVTSSNSGVAGSSPETIRFKGKLYTWNLYQGFESTLHSSDDGEHWSPVGLPAFDGTRFVANSQAMIVTGSPGIMVSNDGVSWVILNGFDRTNGMIPTVVVEGNTFYVVDGKATYSSEDGLHWTPVTGSQHEPDTVISGTARFRNGLVSYDGGRNWVRLLGGLTNILNVVPVNGGFLFLAASGSPSTYGVKLLKSGDYQLSDVWIPASENPLLFMTPLEGKVLFGEQTKSLYSTSDGVQVTQHTPPPNKYRATFVRHGGEWLAVSHDSIWASPDLADWRRLINFVDLANPFGISDYMNVRVSPYGADSLMVWNLSVGMDQRRFIVGPDLAITESPLRFNSWDPPMESSLEQPGGMNGGVRLKGRVMAVGYWVHSKPGGVSGEWKRAGLGSGGGFEPPYENYQHEFKTSTLNAATSERFIMLIKAYDRRYQKDLIYHSTDGENIQVNLWSAPVTLDEVTFLAASADSFIAGVTNGRVLKSANGFDWTMHDVSPGLAIEALFHAHGRWNAAGTHPGKVVNGAWVAPWTEILSSVDGTTWQQTWENRSTTQSFIYMGGAFTAHGRTWVHHNKLGWYRTSDGLTWQVDPAAQAPSLYTPAFDAKGSHPEGILATHSSMPGQMFILNPDTWKPIRTIDFRGMDIQWITQWPFLRSPGRLVEWTEADPRITGIAAASASPSVGDLITLDVSAAELPGEQVPLRVFLSGDGIVGHPANRTLGSIPWAQGMVRPDGSRRFTIALPPTADPGSFRVGAELVLGGQTADLGLQNNLRATTNAAISIPGYQLAVTTTGDGSVTRNDPRGYLPRGFPVELAAGENFDHWMVNGVHKDESTLAFPLMEDTAVNAIFDTNGLEALRDAVFAGSPAGTDRSWNGDPDADGAITWHEILLGTSPLVGGGSAMGVSKEHDGVKFTYQRLAGTPANGNVVPEFSTGLGDWSVVAPFEVQERVLGTSGDFETVELTIPLQTEEGRFVRLRLPLPPETE